jgi:hypothetical protein
VTTLWTEITPHQNKVSGAEKSTVSVGLRSNGSGGRYKQWLAIFLRPDCLWPAGIALGKTVKVHQGQQDGKAMLRITPGGPFTLIKIGGIKGKADSAIQLRLPALPGQSGGAQPLTRVNFDLQSSDGFDSLLIELPAWATECPQIVPPAPAARPAVNGTAAPAPYRMGAPSHKQVLKDNGVIR